MKALYAMSLVCKRLNQEYLCKNYLPSLQYIADNFKSPAVSMCLIGVYEAIAETVGPEGIAGSILPIMCPLLSDRTLTRQQFQLVSARVESMLKKV